MAITHLVPAGLLGALGQQQPHAADGAEHGGEDEGRPPVVVHRTQVAPYGEQVLGHLGAVVHHRSHQRRLAPVAVQVDVGPVLHQEGGYL